MEEKNRVRKIVAFTGIRSEYDLQYSVARELNSNINVDFGFFVFGAHLSEKFGYTLDLIKKDNFKIVCELLTLFDDSSEYSKAKSAAILMLGISDYFRKCKPDIIIVSGDREETIVAATVATFYNIPIAHLYGGDRTFPEGIGNIDEQIRHATTKLSHIHFPTHPEHAKRILNLGEEEWRVHCLGSPALDKFKMYENLNLNVVSNYFNTSVSKGQYAVLIHHSLPNNIVESKEEIENILKVLLRNNIKTFISYPNNDPGNNIIINTIEKFANDTDNFILYKNLEREIFIPLISNSKFLIGNSSMGLVECPILEIPAINVGKRQQKRLNAGNVIFTSYEIESIQTAVDKINLDPKFKEKLKACKHFYGDGNSGAKIAKLLSSVELGSSILAKNISY